MLTRPKLTALLLVCGLSLVSGGLQAEEALRAGKISFAKHNYKEALSLFQKAKAANPSDGEPYYYSGLVHERMGNKSAAMTEFRRATELNMPADAKDKAFWKLILYFRFVEDWENLHSVATRFLAYRRNPEVEKFKEQAEANLNPGRRKVQKLLAEGADAEKKGRAADALSHYAEAARLEPGNVKILWKAADAYRKLDRCPEALRLYHKAIDVDSSAWYSHYQSAVCLYRLQHFSDAIRSFDAADRLNEKPEPSFRFYLHTGRGMANLEVERLDEADRSLRILRENKGMFAKSPPAAILAAMLAALKNDKASLEPTLSRIGDQETDRQAIPVIRSIRAALAADFPAAEKELDPLFPGTRKRGRLEVYTAQLLVLIANHHLLSKNVDSARSALAHYRSLHVSAEIQGSLFRAVLTNPLTPFREDRANLAAAYAKDLRLFAAHPAEAADIVEGRLLYEAGEPKEARAILEKAKADPLCLLYLGILQYDAGELVAARKNVKEALHRDPDLRRRIVGRQVLVDLVDSPDPVPTPPGDGRPSETQQ